MAPQSIVGPRASQGIIDPSGSSLRQGSTRNINLGTDGIRECVGIGVGNNKHNNDNSNEKSQIHCPG